MICQEKMHRLLTLKPDWGAPRIADILNDMDFNIETIGTKLKKHANKTGNDA